MHDGHAAAGDQIPNCILPDGVTRQPVEDWDPAQQSLLQPLFRTPAAHTQTHTPCALCISHSFGSRQTCSFSEGKVSKERCVNCCTCNRFISSQTASCWVHRHSVIKTLIFVFRHYNGGFEECQIFKCIFRLILGSIESQVFTLLCSCILCECSRWL